MSESLDARAMEAATEWARTVFSAPKDLRPLIKRVEKADEVLERVATKIVRRTLHLSFAPTDERRSTAPKVDLGTIDPFAYTLDALRADSQHVTACDGCGGTGRSRCRPCSGTGSVTCSQCGGHGSFRNPATNRMNQCKRCKKSGHVACVRCGGDGKDACETCRGSGHKLCWLTFAESTRWELQLTRSPTVTAHPYLEDNRPLERSELDAFSVDVFVDRDGPIGGALPAPRRLVDEQLSRVDSRIERVVRQQYVQVTALRRDVIYDMCGLTGRIVVSGKSLRVASTAEALRPIKRRLQLGIGGVLLAMIVLGILLLSLSGSTSYFTRARQIAGGAFAGAAVALLPWLMGVLRTWGGRGTQRVSWTEKIMGAGSLVAVGIGVVMLLSSRPSIGEADDAVGRKDHERARVVLAALKETHGDRSDVRELEDRLRMSESATLDGDAKLSLLDAVAGGGGSNAPQAAAAARAERLAHIRKAIAERQPTAALAAIESWFPSTTDVEVLEEQARAYEASIADCAGIACRYSFQGKAARAHESLTRAAAFGQLRAELEAALVPPSKPEKDMLQHLRNAQTLETLVTDVLRVADPTDDIRKRAQSTADWIAAERAKVPILGSTVDVVEQLVGNLQRTDQDRVSKALPGGLIAFFRFDAKGRCTGIYAVGAEDQQRAIVSAEWPPLRLISQAIGKPSRTPLNPTAGVQKWYEGAPIVARYADGILVELRIGQASP